MELSVLVVDWLRLSVADPLPFDATCAPLAELVFVSVLTDLSERSTERFVVVFAVERSELSIELSVLVVDIFRLSVAVPPLFAAT
jgi:hypothetical protein